MFIIGNWEYPRTVCLDNGIPTFPFCLTLKPKVGDVTASIRPHHVGAQVSLDENYLRVQAWVASTNKTLVEVDFINGVQK